MSAERCRAEIARIEEELRAGVDPADMQGQLQGLQDWSAELREIVRMVEEHCG